MRHMRTAVLAYVLLAVATPPLFADDDQRASLAGLQKVLFHVDAQLNVDYAPAGLTAESLQTLAELTLRESSVSLERLGKSPPPTDNVIPQVAVLVLRVRLTNSLPKSYAFTVEYVALQSATLKRKPDISLLAGTWDYSSLGTCAEAQLLETIRQAVVSGAEAFANDYLAANPANRR